MEDLTIADSTQMEILSHLRFTERMLATAASKESQAEERATIWAMPDLGMPNNVGRMLGGFFTGALYTWETRVPIVPIDATVNSCGVSVFHVKNEIPSKAAFDELIRRAITTTNEKSSYIWNFASGNHFITYGEVKSSSEIPSGKYVALHSSASEFKKQANGLYPVTGNWYWDRIKTISDSTQNRFLRYIEGATAERFFKIAQSLEHFNRLRHEYFAGLVFGEDNILDELINEQHYGMPTPSSIAIGCQWNSQNDLYLLLTAPERPLFFVKPQLDGPNTAFVDEIELRLTPHGLGKKGIDSVDIHYLPEKLSINGHQFGVKESLEGNQQFRVRNFSITEVKDESIPLLVSQILSKCPGTVIARMEPIFSYYNSSNS